MEINLSFQYPELTLLRVYPWVRAALWTCDPSRRLAISINLFYIFSI